MSILLAALALDAQSPAPECRADRVAISLDGRDGEFNGMSHSGTLLVLRNKGAPCRISALPLVHFSDAKGRNLPIARQVPIGMHPGPVIVPVTVPANGLVSTPLRWISGQVFEAGRCLHPTRIVVTIGRKAAPLPFATSLCAPAQKAAMFEQPPLRLGLDTGL